MTKIINLPKKSKCLEHFTKKIFLEQSCPLQLKLEPFLSYCLKAEDNTISKQLNTRTGALISGRNNYVILDNTVKITNHHIKLVKPSEIYD